MTNQRKAIYVLLIAACGLVNWAMFRWDPLRKELAALDAQLTALEAESADTGQLAAMTVELGRLEDQLAEQGVARTPGDPREAGLALADLAQRCGLYLDSSSQITAGAAPARQLTAAQLAAQAEAGGAPGATLATRLGQAQPERPLLRWNVWGDFAGLLAFLEALPSLPGAPLVLELQIDRTPQTGPARPPLTIHMVLAA